MLGLKDLTEDQRKGVDHIYSADNTLLVADMGAGKTVCALTAASELLQDGELKRILVVSTIKVARNVWKSEPQKWSHLEHLYVDLALGTELQRKNAIMQGNEITCINFENLVWLHEFLGKDLTDIFDGIIIDEVSKLKSNSGSNFKALRKHIAKFKWRLTMTGTPVSEDWTGLFGEMFMTDGGIALGRNKTKFLEHYFYPTDFERRNWELIPGQEKILLNKIGDKLYHLPDYRHLLPELIEIDVPVEMEHHTRTMYNNFKRDCIMQLNDTDIHAPNAAALTGKLQQICQSFLYSPDGSVNRLKPHKLDVLMQLPCIRDKIPTVVVFWFKEDLTRLRQALADAVVLDGPDSIDQWNAGNISVLLLQPRSASHGLNLQAGGHNLVFYAQTWSNDLTLQTIARLYRRSQAHPVTVYHLLMNDSIDTLIRSRVQDKAQYQTLLIKHLTSNI